MPKRRKGKAYPGRKAPGAENRPPAAAPRDLPAVLAALVLLAVLAGTGLFVDSGADASFDAPKRLTALIGAAAAFLAAFGFSRWENPLAGAARPQRLIVFLSLGAGAWALLSALLSPRQALSLDVTRAIFLTALFLPLGASRVVGRSRTLLVSAFLAVAAVNAVVSILQANHIFQPFVLAGAGSRDITGAFVGNVGYLALNLSFAAVAALAVALLSRRPGLRIAAVAAALLFASALLINRNLTSLTALVAGWCVVSICVFGRRSALPLAGLLLLLAAGVAFYRPMHQRFREAARAVHYKDWDQVVTYRLGPWTAAVAMAKERPLTGWGPGTFGAEYIPHRLKVEIATRMRLTNPLLTSSYGEAHSDLLQPFAEGGIPFGLALAAAAAFLLAGLLRAVRRLDGSARREAIFLLAFLCAGAAAALTWFPLQRPITAVPLLLAAGRAWRIPGGEQAGRLGTEGRA